ncbi:hypothetical protein BURC_02541 [Burkholderiaceae bacterium]|nr:hypothetical protein BURC_02541 [Burkholderiaceae bacterium]
MHAIQMGLNPAMQAVDMVVEIDGRRVKALIPREVFELCLRSPATPEAWLRCCEEHADVLQAAIRRRFAAKPQDQVVVRSSDFGALAPDAEEAPS